MKSKNGRQPTATQLVCTGICKIKRCCGRATCYETQATYDSTHTQVHSEKKTHATQEIERDSKANAICAASEGTVRGSFFFEEGAVTGQSYLEMLTNWMVPQLAAGGNDYHFQHGVPPCWHLAVRFLKEHLPNRWIGRAGDDQMFCKWPASSPNLVCDFFLWGS